MSVLLWYGKGDDDAINLGSILHVFPAFAEVSNLLKGQEGFDELQSVPGFAEQEVTPWWLNEVKNQGKRFLQEHGSKMSNLKWVIEDLISAIEGIGKTPSSEKSPQVGPSPFRR